jgi:Flp pilus assembly protein TadD
MTSRLFLGFAASFLAVGFMTAGCKGTDRPASASAVVPRADTGAAKAAGAAHAALGAGHIPQAVAQAEQAVALQPRDARYRALLGQTYLAAGRFVSAATSFHDARVLDPADGRAGLNLALAEVALGNRAAALSVLAEIRGSVDEGDRGLAMALAGDRAGAVAVLDSAARAPGADARTRQNLALAHALAGEWRAARTIAAQDLSGDALEQRMRQWARFSQPSTDWQQVAALLNVAPALDRGQPVALALVAEPAGPVATAAAPTAAEASLLAATAPVVAPLVAAPTLIAAPAAPSVAAMPGAPVAVTAVASAPTPMIYKQPAPAETARVAAFVQPAAATAPSRDGRFVIQLGAYSSVARVEAGWRRSVARFHLLADYAPTSGSVVYRGTTLHRLALSGFGTRAEASGLCARLKADGGDCFVRAAAGERLVRLSPAPGTQLASR